MNTTVDEVSPIVLMLDYSFMEFVRCYETAIPFYMSKNVMPPEDVVLAKQVFSVLNMPNPNRINCTHVSLTVVAVPRSGVCLQLYAGEDCPLCLSSLTS